MRRVQPDAFYRSRFWEYVDKSGECWLWTRALNADGYGVAHCRIGGRVIRSAHRAAYTLEVGPIPEGLTIDHLCRVRNCVRPDHLEAVTLEENNRRMPVRGGGRPKKQPGEHYRTPARSWKPPPELYERLKAATEWKGETVTNVLIRAATTYVEQVEREQGKR